MPEAKIYRLTNTEKEAHFPDGNQVLRRAVAVCWNISTEDYEDWYIPAPEYPYISFLTVREDRGDYYQDEDSPVEGGLSPVEALEIAEELKRAVNYLSRLQEVDLNAIAGN